MSKPSLVIFRHCTIFTLMSNVSNSLTFQKLFKSSLSFLFPSTTLLNFPFISKEKKKKIEVNQKEKVLISTIEESSSGVLSLFNFYIFFHPTLYLYYLSLQVYPSNRNLYCISQKMKVPLFLPSFLPITWVVLTPSILLSSLEFTHLLPQHIRD